MSVINTWMDMPDNCIVCPEREKTFCNAMKGSSIALDMKNKPNWCPFKSIDGLIEKLISSGFVSTDDLIVKMIRDYCEMDNQTIFMKRIKRQL